MRCPQGARRLVGIDHGRDIALGRTLRDRADVDTGAAQRPEEAPRHARRARHPVADYRDDALCVSDVDALDLTAYEFNRKGIANYIASALRDFLRYGDADGVLRTGLRNQRNRDTGLLERREQAIGRARHTDHARTLEVDERHAADGRYALDILSGCRRCFDAAAHVFGIEAVANDDRNIIVDRRPQRLRMDDLGTEIGEFHGLVVGKLIDDARLGHAVRIRTHDAIDVGPYAQLVGLAERRKNRG